MSFFIQDTFTGGAGPLSGHTPEVNTWAAVYPNVALVGSDDTAPLTHLSLTGAGLLQYDRTATNDTAIQAGTNPNVADVYLEAVVALGVGAGHTLDVTFGFRTSTYVSGPSTYVSGYIATFSIFDDTSSTQRSVQMSTNYNIGSGSMGTFADTLPDGSPASFGDLTVPLADHATSVTLRTEIIGRLAKMYINGVHIYSESWTGDALDGPGNLELDLTYDAGSGAGLHKLDSITAGVPPGVFWTDFVKTSEVVL